MHSKGDGGRVQSAVGLKKQIETISHSPLVHQVTYRLLDSLVVECGRFRVQSPVKDHVIPKTL